MNYLLKLLIPIGLGILAAFINYAMVTSQTKLETFVTVALPVEAGTPFDLVQVAPLELPQKFGYLSKSIVPFSNRGIISGRVTRRKIEPGDPVFFADFDLGGEWLALESGEELFPLQLQDIVVDPSLLRIGNMIHLRVPSADTKSDPEWIGPFRIVAVGSKINNNFGESNRGGGGTGTISLGLAYNPTRDARQIKQLELFCDRQRTANAKISAVRLQDTRR
jgi:hypothetical protein